MSSQPHRVNPFPGLRPFTQEEDYLFFGREEQTIELLQRLAGNRFVAVVGTSGSGKSSLVRCGLLSELLGGKMRGAGSSWEIAVTHPGGNPLALLAEALVEADLYDDEEENVRENLLATLSRSHFGLVEAVKQAGLGDETNFLLVVDQFEEIFRFHEAGQTQQEAANEFVSILLEAVAQSEVPIYVVLTMRSDFIGECGQFEGLAEMVNRGEFLIPRLNREQYKRVIEGPVKVAGGKIAPRLLQRLLNDLGQQADQLPCLQHALMRTWTVWSEKGDTDALDLDDYQRVGKMTQALSLHADEVYESLETAHQRELCQGLFQSLTVQESENRGIRRPQRLGRLCQILDVTDDELLPIIDTYRQSGVTFLMPPAEVKLTDQTIIDISHESLMRVWTRLRHWVDDEAQAAGIYLRLSESAALHEQGKAGLYRDPELGIAVAWRESQQPNAAWAERYQQGFDAALAFLDASQQAAVSEEQEQEAARQRELQQARRLAEAERQRAADQARSAVRLRRLVRGLGVVAAVALVATVFAWLARQDARRNADVAAQKADEADRQKVIAIGAKQDTEEALDEAKKQKEQAEIAENLAKENEAEAKRQREAAETASNKARAAETAALAAEKRSRAFRYSTDMQLAGRLIQDENATARKIFDRLSDQDPAKNKDLAEKDDLRDFEWYYIKRLVDARTSVLNRFEKPVVATVLTPENELVTLDEDAVIRRLDVETGLETRPPLNLKDGCSVAAKALSPNGRQVAVVSGNKTLLLDATTGRQTGPAVPSRARIGVLFSHDSRMLVTVDAQVGWWDIATGKPIALETSKLELSSGLLSQGVRATSFLSLSTDGLTLAVGGQSTRYLSSSLSVFRMNPDTREVTILFDKKEAGIGTIRSVRISPDGTSVFASKYFTGDLFRFDVATGTLAVFNRSEHKSSVSHIAFNADGTELVTGSLDGMIKVWKDYQELKSPETEGLLGHAGEVDLVAFIGDGKRLISSSRDQTVRIWELNVELPSLSYPVEGVTSSVQAVFSPDGLLVACAEKGQLRLWNAATGQSVRSFKREGDGQVYSIAFSPDGRLLAAGYGAAPDATTGVSLVELWDIDRGERLAVMPGSTDIPGFTTNRTTGVVSGLAFSPDGSRLVVSFGSPSSYPLENNYSYPLKVYDVASRRTIRILKGHMNHCIALAFSPDGSRMVSGSFDGTMRVWDTATWRELLVKHNPDPKTPLGGQRVEDLAFSSDGKLLAMASAEGTAVIWDTATWEHIQTLRGHGSAVQAVAFSPDGHTLATGSQDQTVRLWNTTTWRDMSQLTPEGRIYPTSLAFSPDGRRLLVAGKGAQVWSARGDDESETQALAVELASLLKSKSDFRNRIRMVSETLRLREALEKLAEQEPDNELIQTALVAVRSIGHVAHQEWKLAATQFDRIKQLSPEKPDAWLRTPGLLRLATALLHQDRPAAAAMLLTGGEKRRAEDGNGTRAVAFGYSGDPGAFPIRLAQIFRGSPAWQAGLREGDLLLKINDVEISAKTISQYAELTKGGAGTTVTMTILHLGQEQPETVELTKASHIQDDVTVELIETLLAAVDQKLTESPQHPGLLELRAELAGQSSDYERQVADYTAAIESLSERPEDEAVADLARLYCRRGSVYVGLKRWQPALDDYAKGITAETTDDERLANQALARANVVLGIPNWTVLKPHEIRSQGGATLTLQEDLSILAGGPTPDLDRYTIVAQSTLKHITAIRLEVFPDPSLPHNGPGRYPRNGNFHLNEFRVLIGDAPQSLSAVAVSYAEYPGYLKTIDGHDGGGFWGVGGRIGQRHIAVFTAELSPDAKQLLKFELVSTGKHHLGRFRISVSDDPAAFENEPREFATMQMTDPWTKLAAAYQLTGDEQAIDDLVTRRPQASGAIGDLFIQGDDEDWQRALAIYSKGITPETTDKDLLARRARAFEELKDWDAAAADWARAAGENPDGAKLLTDFASRLPKAEQHELAAMQREHARELLEATLQADSGDEPAADTLAQLLLASEPKWTILKSAEIESGAGTHLSLKADEEMLTERGNPDAKFESLVMQTGAGAVQAVRSDNSIWIHTSADATFYFDEYQIASLESMSKDTGAMRGRYVRIDLPGKNVRYPRQPGQGDKKVLSLREVEVFQGDENVALAGSATQSTTASGLGGLAKLAIDGNTNGKQTNGNWGNNTTTHTTAETGINGPWWEVDLGGEKEIDRMVIWNRPDVPQRLRNFRVLILDASRNIVFEQFVVKPPEPSLEIDLPATAAPPRGVDAEARGDLRLAIRLVANHEKAKSITDPRIRLAVAYDLDGATASSADWFIRALNDAETDSKRKPVLKHLLEHSKPLAELLQRTPDDIDLQLALARSHIAEGQRQLTREQPGQALTEFNNAQGIFARLLEQYPEPAWTVLKPTDLKSEGGATLTLQGDGSVLAGGDNPDRSVYTVVGKPRSASITALRLEVIPDSSFNGRSGRHPNGNFVLARFTVSVEGKSPSDIRLAPISEVFADYRARPDARIEKTIDGNDTTRWDNDSRSDKRHFAVFKPTQPITLENFEQLKVILDSGTKFKHHGLGRFRLSTTSDPNAFSTARIRLTLPDSELADLDVPIGKALAQQDKIDEAATAFTRALDRVEKDDQRKKLFKQIKEHQAALTLMAEQRPKDLPLQLALAQSLAESGKKALDEERDDEALQQLTEAQELYTRLGANQSEWTVLQLTEKTSEGGAELTLQPDGSIFVSGVDVKRDTYTLTAPLNGRAITGIRLEALPDTRLPIGGSSRHPIGNGFLLSEIMAAIESPGRGMTQSMSIDDAFADFPSGTIQRAFDSNDSTYWSVHTKQTVPHNAIFTVAPSQLANEKESLLRIQMQFGTSAHSYRNLGRFRLSVTSDPNTIEVAKFQQELKGSGLADLEIALGNAHGGQGRIDEAATAFNHALDRATDRDAKAKIVQEASAHADVLDKLTELRTADADFHDALARHFQKNGDFAEARDAATTARALYEQQLQAEPSNSNLAKELADLLLAISPVEWTILRPLELKSAGDATLTLQEDGSILASGRNVMGDQYTLIGKTDVGPISLLRIEALPHSSLPKDGPGRNEWGQYVMARLKMLVSSEHSGDSSSSSGQAPSDAVSTKGIASAGGGWISDQRGNPPGVAKEAIYHFGQALEQNDDAQLVVTMAFENVKTWGIRNLGHFRLSVSGDADGLEREKKRIAALQVTSTWVRLGAAYSYLGDADKALDAFARSIEMANTDQAKAAAAQQAAAFDDIVAGLLERFPDDKSLRLGQAKYLASQHIAENQFQPAVDVLSGVASDFPDDIVLLNQRASAHMKLAQWQAADSDYARIIALEKDDGRRRAAERTRAEVQLRMGEFEQGAEAFLQEMLLSPGDWARVRDASSALLLAGNPGATKAAATRFYDRFNSDKSAGRVNQLVRCFITEPGLITQQNSKKLLAAARIQGGGWAEPMAAAIHYRLGDLKRAEPLLINSNGRPQFEALAAMLLYDQGKIDEARELLRGAQDWLDNERAKDPGSAIPAQQVWHVWIVRMTVWREAARKLIGPRITELDELLATEPKRTPELLERAGLLADAGLHDQAFQDLERLVALKVDSVETHTLHGRVLAGLDRTEEALPHLNQAIEAGSQDAGVYAARGAILLKQDQTEQARSDLEKSLELGPTELAARSLADLLLAEAEEATNWTVLKPTEMKSEGGATLTLLEDGSILASGENPEDEMYTIAVLSKLKTLRAIRLEALQDESLPNQGPGRTSSGMFVMKSMRVIGVSGALQDSMSEILLDAACADYFLQSRPIQPRGEWHISGGGGTSHVAVYHVAEGIPTLGSSRLSFEMKFRHWPEHPRMNLGRFRLSVTDDPNAFAREENRLAALKSDNPWIRLAHARLLNEDLDRAADNFARGFQRATDDAERTAIFEQLSELGDIFSEFVRQLDDDPQFHQDADRLAKRARAFGKLDRPDEAAADWQRAWELHPGDVELVIEWAALHERLGQSEQAAAVYGRLIEQRRNNADSPDEFARALRLRGAHYVRASEWKLAAADYAQSVTVDPDSTSIDWMMPAALWAYAADAEQHRLHCQKMAARFRDSMVTNDVERTVKVSLLLDSGLVSDPATITKFLDAVAKTEDPGSLKWFLACKALLACRNGDYAAAQQSVEKSLELQKAGEDEPGSMAGLMARSVQTLIFARQGDSVRAQGALDALKSLMATVAKLKWQDDGTLDGTTFLNEERVQHDWLIPEILRREAQAKIDSKTEPAPPGGEAKPSPADPDSST